MSTSTDQYAHTQQIHTQRIMTVQTTTTTNTNKQANKQNPGLAGWLIDSFLFLNSYVGWRSFFL